MYIAIGNRLHDHPKPAYAGSRKADDGRLWVFVATNLFGNSDNDPKDKFYAIQVLSPNSKWLQAQHLHR
jgi:hypothetical protein